LQNYIAGLEMFDRGRLRDLVAAIQSRHMLDHAITVVLADHGEGRDRPPSRRMTHDLSLADDIMHIPLYIRLPGQQKPERIAEQVSEADVTPTILDLLGLPGESTAALSEYSGRSLAPLLHGKQLPRRPAYAEVSRSNNDPTRPVAQTAGERIATVHARVLRYPERKYRLAGEFDVVDSEVFLREPADFLRLVCRFMLGRVETADDAARLMPIYQNPSLSRDEKWATLSDLIKTSDEWRLLDKYAVYDLQSDPLEVKPLDPFGRRRWNAYWEHVLIMRKIHDAARPGAPLLTSDADEQVILKRLQDLGYVE
jgi:hypothetical protein